MRSDFQYTPELTDGYEEHLVQRLTTSKAEANVIRAATEVHRQLGPGLLQSAYKACLCKELDIASVPFQRDVTLPISYKGLRLKCAYTLDLVVDQGLVVEIKAVEELLPVHSARLLTYLKCSDKRTGLLINFDVAVLKYGLKRVVSRYMGSALTPPAPVAEAIETKADGRVVELGESTHGFNPSLRRRRTATGPERFVKDSS